MKRIITLVLILLLLLSCMVPAYAQEAAVIYEGTAEKFIFVPGTLFSPSDLFPEFKDVMPGDTLEQRITVRNDVSNNCKVKIYMRALGALPLSHHFLAQMNLTVEKADDTVLFDAPASERAQLSDWVYLGTLYSGGECELIATLEVPVTMDSHFENHIGYLIWEFAVEELPVEPTDPEPPKTGDNSNIVLWSLLMAGSLILLILLFLRRKKKQDD